MDGRWPLITQEDTPMLSFSENYLNFTLLVEAHAIDDQLS